MDVPVVGSSRDVNGRGVLDLVDRVGPDLCHPPALCNQHHIVALEESHEA